MSATGRGALRIANDAYSTPPETIRPVLDNLYIPHVSTFLEPCRGEGAIYDLVRCHRRLHCEIREGSDYLSWSPKEKVSIIVTNPPFSLALQFLEKSLGEADTVVYLLRLGFLGSQERNGFWERNKPTHLIALSKRPCFVWSCKGSKPPVSTKGCGALYKPGSTRVCEVCGGKVAPGTDATDYGWFFWDKAGLVNLAPGIYAR